MEDLKQEQKTGNQTESKTEDGLITVTLESGGKLSANSIEVIKNRENPKPSVKLHVNPSDGITAGTDFNYTFEHWEKHKTGTSSPIDPSTSIAPNKVGYDVEVGHIFASPNVQGEYSYTLIISIKNKGTWQEDPKITILVGGS